jgi:hypothetical protein
VRGSFGKVSKHEAQLRTGFQQQNGYFHNNGGRAADAPIDGIPDLT